MLQKTYPKRGIFQSIDVEVQNKWLGTRLFFSVLQKKTSRDRLDPHYLHYHIDVSCLRTYTSVGPDEL